MAGTDGFTRAFEDVGVGRRHGFPRATTRTTLRDHGFRRATPDLFTDEDLVRFLSGESAREFVSFVLFLNERVTGAACGTRARDYAQRRSIGGFWALWNIWNIWNTWNTWNIWGTRFGGGGRGGLASAGGVVRGGGAAAGEGPGAEHPFRESGVSDLD